MIVHLKNHSLTVFELEEYLLEYVDNYNHFEIVIEDGVETLSIEIFLYEIKIKIKEGVLFLETALNFAGIACSFTLGSLAIIPGFLCFFYLMYRKDKTAKIKAIKEL